MPITMSAMEPARERRDEGVSRPTVESPNMPQSSPPLIGRTLGMQKAITDAPQWSAGEGRVGSTVVDRGLPEPEATMEPAGDRWDDRHFANRPARRYRAAIEPAAGRQEGTASGSGQRCQSSTHNGARR